MPKDIRITDPHTIQLLEGVRIERGDRTSAKTARDIIREHITVMNERRDRDSRSPADARESAQSA